MVWEIVPTFDPSNNDKHTHAMSIYATHIAKRTQDGKAIATKPQCGKAYEYATGKHPYVRLTKGFCDDIRAGRKVCKNCLATAVEQGRVSMELAEIAKLQRANA